MINLSFLIIVHNEEKQLKSCLETVKQAQTDLPEAISTPQI